MTAEQKKIALVAVAGGGGLLLLWYLLRSRAAGFPQAIPAGAAAAGYGPLDIPPGSDITYNFPGMAPPTATVTPPSGVPSCVKLCDNCDDNSAFAGVASYQISPAAMTNVTRSLAPALSSSAPQTAIPLWQAFYLERPSEFPFL